MPLYLRKEPGKVMGTAFNIQQMCFNGGIADDFTRQKAQGLLKSVMILFSSELPKICSSIQEITCKRVYKQHHLSAICLPSMLITSGFKGVRGWEKEKYNKT